MDGCHGGGLGDLAALSLVSEAVAVALSGCMLGRGPGAGLEGLFQALLDPDHSGGEEPGLTPSQGRTGLDPGRDLGLVAEIPEGPAVPRWFPMPLRFAGGYGRKLVVHCRSMSGQIEQHSVEVEGHRLVVIQHGQPAADGPPAALPVVFLHGITASPRAWSRSLPEQFEQRCWLSVSLPGHYPGALAHGVGPQEIDDVLFARLIAAVIRSRLGQRKVLIVGWSTGGFSALSLALHQPDCVAGVLCISGFASGRWGGLLGLTQRIARMGRRGHRIARRSLGALVRSPLLYMLLCQYMVGRPEFLGAAAHRSQEPPSLLGRLGRKRARLVAGLRRGRTPGSEVPTWIGAGAFQSEGAAGTVQDLWEDYCRHDLDSLATLFAGLRDVDILQRLPAIDVPTWIVGGDLDRVVPLRHTREMAAQLSGARLIVWQGVGHMFLAECVAEFQALLLACLVELEADRSPARSIPTGG